MDVAPDVALTIAFALKLAIAWRKAVCVLQCAGGKVPVLGPLGNGKRCQGSDEILPEPNLGQP